MHSEFSPQWWEQHYQEHAARHHPPNSQLMAEVTGLAAGTALDAGCGRGSGALWLASQGWQVTAADVSPTAIEDAKSFAGQAAQHITWVVADLTTWLPPERFDLVISQHVHPAMPSGEFVARLAQAVAPGGTLLVVNHLGEIDVVTSALSPNVWDVTVAETRGDELVVKARRSR